MAVSRVPQPVTKGQSAPKGPPRGTPAKSRNQLTPADIRTSVAVSPESHAPRTAKLGGRKERILMIGDSVSGKTYAYLMMAQEEWLKHQADPEYKMAKFYVLDLDNTMPAYLGPNEIFEHLYYENGGNVYPYQVDDWASLAGSVHGIMQAKPVPYKDWVIIDPADRMYEQAQQIIAEQPQIAINVAESTIERGLNHQGFGAFQGDAWNLVSRTHDTILAAINKLNVNELISTHATDLVIQRERRINLVLYDNVGVKHKGRPTLPEFVDTVVVIWAKQNIPLNEKNQRGTGASFTDRYMYIAKDRGKPFSFQVRYADNFWAALRDARTNKDMMPVNIESDEHRAQLVAAGTIRAEDDEPEEGLVQQDRPHMPGMDGIDGFEEDDEEDAED